MGLRDRVGRVGRHSLRYFGNGSALIGVVLIGFVWLSVNFFLENERRSAEQAAVKNAMNLAGAFEEHLVRSLGEIDRALKVVRARYVRGPEELDLMTWANGAPLFNDDVLQVSVIDARGFLKLSSVAATKFTGIDLSDREHFRVHLDGHGDELFISKPVIGRTTGKWSIQLARRIVLDDGSFGGVIVASLDPVYLTRIYNSVNIGSKGHIRILGVDGILRASSGDAAVSLLGQDLAGSDLFKVYPRETSGWYFTDSRFSDWIPRLVSFRAVKSYPLIITIGQSSREIFALIGIKRYVGNLVAGILTLLIFAVTMFSIHGGLTREEDKKRLERSNMLLHETLVNMPHGVCMFGPDQKLVIANALYSRMYGLDPAQTKPGMTLREILELRIAAGCSPRDSKKYIVDRLQEAFVPMPGYIINELQDGRVFAVSRQPMPDGGSVAIHQDITVQKRTEERISHLAHYDSLTGLANRVLFLEHVSAAAERYRKDGSRFAVHLLDLDRFKEVNDSLGHAVGDTLLFAVASRLRDSVGPADVVARLGGDEFIVLQALDGQGDDQVAALAGRLLAIISKPFDIEAHHLAVETSIGVVVAPDHGIGADELLKKADVALYRAKSAGRNGWRLFESEMEAEARARLALAMDLRNSVAREEFVLHYQPVVNTADRTVAGVEALVRWRSPQRGLVPPNTFIPLAEDTGLIIPLGEWVLRRACQDAAGWPSHISVAVNLSPVQIRSGNIVEFVKRTLQEAGLRPDRLELEVTESVLLEHDERNLDVLRELQSLGIAIVLDDFGTGYSSMSYLLKFPFDKIKIDRSFVAELTRRDDCAAIVAAVSGLARSLDIATTAEGVETDEQFAQIRAAGYTLAQGYLFGRPCINGELSFEAAPAPAAQSVA